MATIQDVAQKAGVSTATISRYLNSSGYVNKDTGKRIEEACRELGYSLKKSSGKSGGNANTIGVIVTEINNYFFAEAIEAIEHVAERYGKDVIVCDSRERSDVEIRNIELLKTRVGGLIVVPASQMVSYNAQYLKEINDKVMPVVLFDRDVTMAHLDGVFVDDYTGAYEGVVSLAEQGHRNIAIISGPTTSKPGLERLNGYLQALKDHGIPVKEEYILYGDFKQEKAYALTKKLLEKKYPVTAVFAGNIYMGLGALKAIDEYGYSIPQDISFLTFDDYPTFDFKHNHYSVVHNPAYHVGEEAALLLIDRMENLKKNKRNAAKRIVLEPNLILRGSEKFPQNRRK